jgi:uncharacterized protein YkwD
MRSGATKRRRQGRWLAALLIVAVGCEGEPVDPARQTDPRGVADARRPFVDGGVAEGEDETEKGDLGASSDDRCAGVSCEDPPAAICADEQTLRSFARGSCVEGHCIYASSDWACGQGCREGACGGDPCEGLVCDHPPAARCVGNLFRTYSTGTCAGGQCSYPYQDTVCPSGCALPGGCRPSHSHDPIGVLDGMSGGEARGWACDPDDPAASIEVQLYVGGPLGSGTGHAFTADRASEAAVNNRCGGGSAHRFSFEMPGWDVAQDQVVYAYGVDSSSGGGTRLLDGSPLRSFASEILARVNQERQRRGRSLLKRDPAVAAVARAYSQLMCDRGFLSHTGPDGSTPQSRMVAGGVFFLGVGENLLAGATTPAGAMQSWMQSAPHRDNILLSAWTHLGVGYVRCGPHDARWTQDFLQK